MNDPFRTLGVEPGASEADIKKAYKKMAMEHHPDRHPNDKQAEERFKEISVAYETLKNNNWQQESWGPNFNGDIFNGFSSINIEDLFNHAFGQNPFNRQTGNVKTGKIYISLEEAYSGCTKKIGFIDTVSCSVCNGLGYKLGDEKCDKCGGIGQRRTVHGAVSMVTACADCRGFGRKISAMCMECNGTGKKKLERELIINIPPGTYEGAKVNPTNDVQIQILYSPHKEYTIMNNRIDTSSIKEIDVFVAMLGGTVSANTLGGIKNVKVPAGCQPETLLRIKQAGMKIQNKIGDHLLKIKIKIPTNLTEEQKELIQTLKQQLEENNGEG
jgi:molecular chaperone DnaJ